MPRIFDNIDQSLLPGLDEAADLRVEARAGHRPVQQPQVDGGDPVDAERGQIPLEAQPQLVGLVEAQDGCPIICADPGYKTAFVYGNVFVSGAGDAERIAGMSVHRAAFSSLPGAEGLKTLVGNQTTHFVITDTLHFEVTGERSLELQQPVDRRLEGHSSWLRIVRQKAPAPEAPPA